MDMLAEEDFQLCASQSQAGVMTEQALVGMKKLVYMCVLAFLLPFGKNGT